MLQKAQLLLNLFILGMVRLQQGDIDKINVLGASLKDYAFKFKPHRDIAEPYGLV